MAKVLEWACPACGASGIGEMPPGHEAHKAPKPSDLVVIVHLGWGVTMVPYEYLSPMQERGWWCAPLP